MGIFSTLLQSTQGNRPSGVVGVDIGTSTIKVVEVEDRNGVLTLLTYGEIQLGPYGGQPIGTTPRLTAEQEQAALVDVLRESAVKTKNAVFAMPLSASFISNALISADPDADISAMVRVEARKLIPTALSEVTLDWAELDSSFTDQRSVLIAAIQNSSIERFNILKQFAGFTAAPTEIECFSTNRTVAGQENILVIDFGAASTKMYLASQGIINRMHRVNVGGEAITNAFAEARSIDFAEAETVKLQTTEESERQLLADLCKKHYKQPMYEFMQLYNSYTQDTDVVFDRVLICGGASQFPEVMQIVSDVFELEVERINPFKNVAYPAFMEDAMELIGPGFVPALGAALRPFS